MKKDRPIMSTLRWVIFGAIIGILIYVVHVLVSHEPKPPAHEHENETGENPQVFS